MLLLAARMTEPLSVSSLLLPRPLVLCTLLPRVQLPRAPLTHVLRSGVLLPWLLLLRLLVLP